MLVFGQERHVIEREPQWRRIRSSRKRFERLLDGVLERCEREAGHRFADRRLTMLALLGMVNHAAQWYSAARAPDPSGGRPTASATSCSASAHHRAARR